MLLLFGLSASPAGQLLYLIHLVPSVKSTRRDLQILGAVDDRGPRGGHSILDPKALVPPVGGVWGGGGSPLEGARPSGLLALPCGANK